MRADEYWNGDGVDMYIHILVSKSNLKNKILFILVYPYPINARIFVKK